LFVTEERVPVADDAGNVIYIRGKMNFKTKAMVKDALMAMDTGGTSAHVLIGASQLALLQHNVLAWEGPAFAGMACTAENIGRLDPDEPLVEKVLTEIEARNAKPVSGDPKGVSSSTESGSPVALDLTPAVMTRILS
jgi:hypothetical protein